LTDLLVHGLDIRLPLRLARDIPGNRLRTALTFVTGGAATGIVARGAVSGLRFEARDLDWAHGSGPVVSGDAEALLLAVTGRTTAFGRLGGDGVATLRARLA
jgi:hypothetical protein